MSKQLLTIDDCRRYRQWHSQKTVALVPTMGALHEGHLSLVERARPLADQVILSIFVNPTQFGPNEDFERYPRSLESDLEKAFSAGVDAVFTPSVDEMTAGSFASYVMPDPQLDSLLEGALRPGHFRGVCTIVMKLFQIIQPQVAVFGLKDYQQFAILKKMVIDLALPVQMVGAPIFRENDGLAMSSRNQYLSATQRQQATILYQLLTEAEKQLLQHPDTPLPQLAQQLERQFTDATQTSVEYLQFVHPDTLKPQQTFERDVLLVLAAFFDSVRLIDNGRITSP